MRRSGHINRAAERRARYGWRAGSLRIQAPASDLLKALIIRFELFRRAELAAREV